MIIGPICKSYVNADLTLDTISIIILLGLGTLVLQKGPKNKVHFLYFIFSVSMATWIATCATMDYLKTLIPVAWSIRLNITSGACFTIAMTFLITVYTGYVNQIKLRYQGLYFLTIAYFLYLCFFLKMFVPGPQGYDLVHSSTNHYFSIYSAWCISNYVWSVALILKKRQHLPKEAKAPFTILLIGIGQCVIIVTVASLILPCFQNLSFDSLTRLSLLGLAICIYIAIAKYRLFEIKTALHLTLFWAFASSLITIVFYLMVSTKFMLGRALATLPLYLQALGLFIVFLSYQRWIQPKIDHIFFRKKYKLKEKLLEFTQKIKYLHTLEKLHQTIFETIDHTLYPRKITLLLKNNGHWMWITNDSSPGKKTILYHAQLKEKISEFFCVEPIQIHTEIWGYIGIDEKKTLQPYLADEQLFFKQIADQIGLYHHHTKLYDEMIEKTKLLLKTQDELLKTQKETIQHQEKEKKIRSLSHLISHEVKNVLYGIEHSILALAKNNDIPEKEKAEVLAHLESQCNRLHLYCSNYLYQEKFSLGLLEAKKKPFKINALMKQVLNDLNSLADPKAIAFDTSIEKNETLNGNEETIRILFYNILHNAIRYTFKGTCIRTTFNREKEYCVIRIIDQGPGMKSQSNNNETLGSGMGLSICQKIVDAHAGKLEFISSYSGTEVQIRMPN